MNVKNNFKRMASAMLSGVLLTSAVVVPCSNADSGEMRDISTMELVRDMGIGINLGNTFEACPNWYEEDWIAKWSEGKPQNYETAWGSPVITKEIIQGYADEGFGVLRIPVAWSNMMEHDGNYIINEEYMARVTEVVDWTLETGMYAIINIHWDGGWVNNFPDDKEESMKRYEKMWEQICENFSGYSDYLMFESQNEELGWESIWNKWAGNDGKEESYQLVNEINQKFVDVVRNSGGNNDKRHLLISGYNTGIDVTCDSLFKMPYDPAGRCAVSVHYYTPAGFAILTQDESWGKAVSTWGTDEDYNELYYNLDMMKTNFIDKGIPVIIGEYGCPIENKEPESVRRFLSSVCEAAYTRQLCPILWDTPGGHYDRTDSYQLNDRQLHENYMAIVGDNVPTKPAETTTEPTTETTTENVPEIVAGDIDSDGDLDVADLVVLTEYVLGKDIYVNVETADLYKDSRIDVYDVVILRQLYSMKV